MDGWWIDGWWVDDTEQKRKVVGSLYFKFIYQSYIFYGTGNTCAV